MPRIVAIVVLSSLATTCACAHSLNLFVHEEGGSIKGSAYFTGGGPAKHVEVQVFAAGDQPVATLMTLENGEFTYIGEATGRLRFVASTPDGHRAEATLEAVQTASPAAQGNSDAVSDSTKLEREIGAVQTALDRLEHKLWLRDVIGGIGYIFGLAGLWALWKARGKGARH